MGTAFKFLCSRSSASASISFPAIPWPRSEASTKVWFISTVSSSIQCLLRNRSDSRALPAKVLHRENTLQSYDPLWTHLYRKCDFIEQPHCGLVFSIRGIRIIFPPYSYIIHFRNIYYTGPSRWKIKFFILLFVVECHIILFPIIWNFKNSSLMIF